MLKASLLLALCAAPMLVFLTPSSTSQGASEIGVPPTLFGFTREPTLLYDVTGSSLLGPLHSSLVVYNDGLVSFSSRSGFAGGDGSACTTNVSPEVVKKLTRNLAAAGAGTLADNIQLVLDVPLQTVTFMRPGTTTSAHTFSFFIGTGSHAAVSQLINEFVAEHVPPCAPDISPLE